MTAPSYVASSLTVAQNASGTAAPGTKPGNLADGHLLFCHVVTPGGNNPSTPAAPDGTWTEVPFSTKSVDESMHAVFAKFILTAAGQPATYAFTLAVADVSTVHMFSVVNAKLTSFFGNNTSQTSSGVAGITVPGVVTTAADSLVLGFYGQGNAGNHTTSSSGWTQVFSVGTGVSATARSAGGFQNTMATQGTTPDLVLSGGQSGFIVGGMVEVLGVPPSNAPVLTVGAGSPQLNSSNANVVVPVDPASAEGELLVAVVELRSYTASIITVPSPWQLVGNQAGTNGSNTYIYWMIAPPGYSPPASYTWVQDSSQVSYTIFCRVTDFDTTTPMDSAWFAGVDAGQGQTSATCPDLTAPMGDALVLRVVGSLDPGTHTWAFPATERWDATNAGTISTRFAATGATEDGPTAAGAVGTRVCTIASTGAGAVAITALISPPLDTTPPAGAANLTATPIITGE